MSQTLLERARREFFNVNYMPLFKKKFENTAVEFEDTVLGARELLKINRIFSTVLSFKKSPLHLKIDCLFCLSQRPPFAIGRSLVLLGLMFSNGKVNESRRKIRYKKDQREASKNGYLYVHIHQAKRLPMRNVGMTPDPQIKW